MKNSNETNRREEIVRELWDDFDGRRWDKLRGYFVDNATIDWPNTDERFSVGEFVTVNAEYPGKWSITIEKLIVSDDTVISAVKVSDEDASFHATSFFTFDGEKIARLEEYWGEDGPAPQWRIGKNIGRSIA